MAEFIVAIELGSSKITGIAGTKNLDGSISVLAVVTEDSTSCIRNGVVYNIDKTGQCLTNIINRLKTQLKHDITHVYVGVSGKSIRSVHNVITKELPADTIITQEMVNSLMDTNRNMTYAEQEILDAVTQEYKVDNQLQLDPVGIQCNHLEGHFLNILWHKSFYRYLNKCFDNAGITIAEMYLAPLALADSILSEAEKRSGCALVDLGAETTTVSVYHKNLLRHLVVIPLGGNNITKDIASMQMEEKDAEKMKLKYASALTDANDMNSTLKYPIDAERQVDSSTFVTIVEARLQEIIENVRAQIPNEYIDKLLSGIVLTGGGANMPNIEKAFRHHTGIEKIRVARFIKHTVKSTDPRINDHTGMMNTVLSLLYKGDMNCAGTAINDDLFNTATTVKPASLASDTPKTPRDPNATAGSGVVQTAAEKLAAEEEARRKREEAQREKERRQREEEARMAEERRKNSLSHKLVHKLGGFFKSMVAEEE